jgi:hypothetical protein
VHVEFSVCTLYLARGTSRQWRRPFALPCEETVAGRAAVSWCRLKLLMMLCHDVARGVLLSSFPGMFHRIFFAGKGLLDRSELMNVVVLARDNCTSISIHEVLVSC